MANNIQYAVSLNDINAVSTLNRAEGAAKGFEGALGSLKTVAIAAFAGWGIKEVVGELIDVTRKVGALKTALDFTTSGQGVETFKFLTEYSDKLGLNLETAAQGFKTISGAARGTSLEGEGAIEIFKGISEAGTVMQLTSEQMEGALLALGQVISKGKVQAEELRGQLGERIPGAFQIAARAMNMTTMQLDKFMSDGKLLAEDFLPKFASQLRKEFAGGLDAASQSLNANINRMNNDIFLLKAQIGEDLTPVFLQALKIIREFSGVVGDVWNALKGSEALNYVIERVSSFIDTLKGLYNGLVENLREPIASLSESVAEWQEPLGQFMGFVQDLFTRVWAVLSEVLPLIVRVFDGVLRVLKPIYNFLDRFQVFTAIGNLFRNVLAIIEFVADKLSWIYDNIIKPVLKGFDIAVDRLSDLLGLAKDINNESGLGTTQKVGGFMSLIPGKKYDDFNNVLGSVPDLTKKTSGKGSGSLSGSSSGGSSKVQGQRVLNINITIQKLVDKFEVITTQIQGIGEGKIKDLVTRALLSAVNDSQIVPER